MRNKKTMDRILTTLTYGATMTSVLILVFIIAYIVIMGLPNINLEIFSLSNSKISVIPPMITTIIMTFLSLIIAIPLGLFTAIYLVEYARKGNKIVGLIAITAETLAGIPSIVYGLFGYLFFNIYLGFGYSIIAGALTLSIMILPLIMRTAQEALKSVSDSYREGSYGLGAGRLRTVFKVVLPSAVPGILSGVILAIGRIVGETAALIFTAGTMAQIPTSLTDSARTLSIHMYSLSGEGLYQNEAYATAFILLIVVVGINSLAAYIAKKLKKV